MVYWTLARRGWKQQRPLSPYNQECQPGEASATVATFPAITDRAVAGALLPPRRQALFRWGQCDGQ